MSVTYSPTSGHCVDAIPSFRGAVVRPDALTLHASCDGAYRGGPIGPYDSGCPCCCECHTPDGLPAWMRPQEGEALAGAIALEQKIRQDTEALRRSHPVLPAGRLTDVAAQITGTGP